MSVTETFTLKLRVEINFQNGMVDYLRPYLNENTKWIYLDVESWYHALGETSVLLLKSFILRFLHPLFIHICFPFWHQIINSGRVFLIVIYALGI